MCNSRVTIYVSIYFLNSRLAIYVYTFLLLRLTIKNLFLGGLLLAELTRNQINNLKILN